MPLSPGTTLGVYEITARIGAGGMGEVYRARDTALDRDVAIKVLPEGFATDPERLARFEREAKVLASLNHPNIAAIYGLERGLEKSGGPPALVLELVDGPTLQDRLAQGAIPLEDALPIARQIAEGLEAAHEQGIIHRDLKPANIKVTPDGTVKVLDFGLAKALNDVRSAGASAPATDAANSPTMTMTAAATKMGVILGTAAYMSPEQARGKPVDKRADIWAFGVVLYELLTGRQLFDGQTVSDTLASVLTRDPDWTALPGDTPSSIRRLLRRALEKDRSRRLPHVGDARMEIDDADRPSETGASDPAAVPTLAGWQRPAAVAAITAAITALVVWSLTRPTPAPPAPVTRTSITLPRTHVRTNTASRGVAISPAGTHLVYVANSQLYLRPLDALEAVPLGGTEGSEPVSPFFSPDGQWVGFFSRRDRTLEKVAVAGGAAVTLAPAEEPLGASWGTDETILFSELGRGILRVPATGGTPELLVPVEPPAQARQPQRLSGSEAILYTLGTDIGSVSAWDTARIVVERPGTGERTVLVDGGSDARYLPTGHLVYALGTDLLAVPFDAARLAVTGGPVPLVEGVSRNWRSGATQADVAAGLGGALVYLPAETGAEARTLVWVDRDGTETPLAAPPRVYLYPRLSPDGTRVVVGASDEEQDLWVWDLARETLRRLTFTPEEERYAVWTPDGEGIIFDSQRDGALNLYRRAADGTGAVARLTESANNQAPQAITPDGRALVFREDVGSNNDLLRLTLDAGGGAAPLVATGFEEPNADLSPDGRWLAYESEASGQREVYVRPYPDVEAGGLWQVSTAGGTRPRWGPDGRELFYLTGAGLMGVPIDTADGFRPGRPARLVEGAYDGIASGDYPGRTYDVAPDGTRFLMVKVGGASATAADDPYAGLTRIHVVQNWHQELLERVPIP